MLKHRRLTSKDERWLPPPSTLDEEEGNSAGSASPERREEVDDAPRRIGVADHFEEDHIARALLATLLLEDEDLALRQMSSLLKEAPPEELVQTLLTAILSNRKGLFAFDAEELTDATFYLGTSFRHLNLIQAACFVKDEDLALLMLDAFIHACSATSAPRWLLKDLIEHQWGAGNTSTVSVSKLEGTLLTRRAALHLASFLGMHRLVQKLLEYGAQGTKLSACQCKAVDFADDEATRQVFRDFDVHRYNRTARESPVRNEGTSPSPAFQASLSRSSTSESLLSLCSITSEYESTFKTPSSSPPLPPIKDVAPLKEEALPSLPPPSPLASPLVRRVHWSQELLVMDYCAEGDAEALERLLAVSPDLCHHASPLGYYPIHKASESKSLATLQVLLAYGANVNVVDACGWTPLFYAVDNDDKAIVECLLRAKALTTLLDAEGDSLHILAQSPDVKHLLHTSS